MNFAELLSSESKRQATNGRIYGAVTGIVTNTDDPDSLGRVKLKFPWLADDTESPWARIASPMAGNKRGALFRPEVDDEVLVLFGHGDVRFPYVIGGMWNGVDKPPEHGADGDNNIRLIRSRSGHEITLDDTPGSEKIVIVDKSGSHKLELSSTGVVIESTAIKIGGTGSSEGLVLGNAFMTLFNAHTHPTGVGPSGPPVTPMMPGSHVSAKHKTD